MKGITTIDLSLKNKLRKLNKMINTSIVGKKFGRLLVLSECDRDKWNNILWLCKYKGGDVSYE